MSKRNSRAAKARRRVVRLENRSHVNDLELPLYGATPGCPMVPTEQVPLSEFVMPPGAFRMPDDELPKGVKAAVQWYCRDGCGQDHITMWRWTD